MKNYYYPTRRNEGREISLFDHLENFFNENYEKEFKNMPTDIKETDKAYELSVDLAGFEKKDINLSLKDGYLNISAKREEKHEDGKNFIRRERSYSMSRSFYVGDGIKEEDVKAKYDKGTLEVVIPKKEQEVPEHKHIEIE